MSDGDWSVWYEVEMILAGFAFAPRTPEANPLVLVASFNKPGDSSDETQQEPAEEMREMQEERESLDEFRTTAPYRETRSIKIDPARGKILDFRPPAR